MPSKSTVTGLVSVSLLILVGATAAAQVTPISPASGSIQQSLRGDIRTLDSRELIQLLADLQDGQRIISADGTFQYISGGDAVLIRLEDLNNRDRQIYLYFWRKTSDAFFLQIEGTLETGGEVHLWNGDTEILFTPQRIVTLATRSAHTFRPASIVAPRALGVSDALACIARTAGVSVDGVNLTNVLGVLNGACVAANVTSLALTGYACLTGGTLGCVAGIAQLITCGVANCISTVCGAPPAAPASLVAAVNGSTLTLLWVAAAGSASSYIIEAGSSSGATNISVSDTGTVATSLTAIGLGVGTYFVRVRGKNACGTSGPSNEVVVSIGTTGSRSVWVGPFSSTDGPGTMTLTLNQSGSSVTGTMDAIQNGVPWVGTLSGTFSQSTLAFTATFSVPSQGCGGTFSGSAVVTTTTIRATYSGFGCLHSFSNGQISLTKQ
jgi:hypothetical protein